MTSYVACDVETTGIEPGSRMVELGAVAFDHTGAVQDRFHSMVRPGMPLPADAAAVNGITDDMLSSAPDAGEVLRRFVDWVAADAVVVAHNAAFDVGVIGWESERFGLTVPDWMVLDTLMIARVLHATPDCRLETLAHWYGLHAGDAHRALSDADVCRQYFIEAQRHPGIRSPRLAAVPWASRCSYSYTADLPPELASLPELVAAGGDLAFVYHDTKGDITERTITPYGWARCGDSTLFHGYCHLRRERRTFNVERVVSVARWHGRGLKMQVEKQSHRWRWKEKQK